MYVTLAGAHKDVQHGFDITQTTAEAMKPATVNCQVGAALLMRAHCAANPADRTQALRALRLLINQLRCDTVEHMKCTAWGLPDRARKTPKDRCHRLQESAPSREQTREAAVAATQSDVQRTPQHLARITLASDFPVESNVANLSAQVKERRHGHLQQGTKRALLAGGGAFNGALTQQRADPHLTLAGGAWVLFALADSSGQLEELHGENRKGEEERQRERERERQGQSEREKRAEREREREREEKKRERERETQREKEGEREREREKKQERKKGNEREKERKNKRERRGIKREEEREQKKTGVTNPKAVRHGGERSCEIRDATTSAVPFL